MYVLFSTFFQFRLQKLLKSVKIWQSCSQMYTGTFHESRQNVGFNFSG